MSACALQIGESKQVIIRLKIIFVVILSFVFAANNNFAQSLKTHFLYAKNLHDNNSTKTRQSLYHIEIQFVIKFFTLIYFNCISNDNENIR